MVDERKERGAAREKEEVSETHLIRRVEKGNHHDLKSSTFTNETADPNDKRTSVS